MKFSIIVADPPWGDFKDKLAMSEVARGAEANYSIMTTPDVVAMPVKDLVDPNGAVLALWVPSSLLQDGLDVMNAWGFTQKQMWIWVKTKNEPLHDLKKFLSKNVTAINLIKSKVDEFSKTYWYDQLLSFGMGRISRNVHEIALIGTCGKINSQIKDKSQRTVFFDKNFRHSQKPEILQDRLDLIFPDKSLNRLEIFARRERENWTTIGNQCKPTFGQDILESINYLKSK